MPQTIRLSSDSLLINDWYMAPYNFVKESKHTLDSLLRISAHGRMAAAHFDPGQSLIILAITILLLDLL